MSISKLTHHYYWTLLIWVTIVMTSPSIAVAIGHNDPPGKKSRVRERPSGERTASLSDESTRQRRRLNESSDGSESGPEPPSSEEPVADPNIGGLLLSDSAPEVMRLNDAARRTPTVIRGSEGAKKFFVKNFPYGGTQEEINKFFWKLQSENYMKASSRLDAQRGGFQSTNTTESGPRSYSQMRKEQILRAISTKLFNALEADYKTTMDPYNLEKKVKKRLEKDIENETDEIKKEELKKKLIEQEKLLKEMKRPQTGAAPVEIEVMYADGKIFIATNRRHRLQELLSMLEVEGGLEMMLTSPHDVKSRNNEKIKATLERLEQRFEKMFGEDFDWVGRANLEEAKEVFEALQQHSGSFGILDMTQENRGNRKHTYFNPFDEKHEGTKIFLVFGDDDFHAEEKLMQLIEKIADHDRHYYIAGKKRPCLGCFARLLGLKNLEDFKLHFNDHPGKVFTKILAHLSEEAQRLVMPYSDETFITRGFGRYDGAYASASSGDEEFEEPDEREENRVDHVHLRNGNYHAYLEQDRIDNFIEYLARVAALSMVDEGNLDVMPMDLERREQEDRADDEDDRDDVNERNTKRRRERH